MVTRERQNYFQTALSFGAPWILGFGRQSSSHFDEVSLIALTLDQDTSAFLQSHSAHLYFKRE